MSLRRTLARCAGMLRFGRRRADVDDEIDAHLAALEDELRADGVPPEDARLAARRRFGNVALTRERSREEWHFRWLDELLRDVRFGVRMLLRDRVLSSVIIVVVAVGIASSTAIYSLVSACIIQFDRDYKVIDRWVVVRAWLPAQRAYSHFFSVPELNDVARLRDVFDDVGAVAGTSFTLTEGDFPERILGTRITADIMPAIGVAPLIGRAFRPDDDRPGASPVTVLSYDLWRHRFNADPNALGQTIKLDGVAHTIIGVMPQYYDLWGGELWVPWRLNRADDNRLARQFWIVCVTKAGLSEGQVNARLRVLAADLARDYGHTRPEYAGMTLAVWNIRDAVIGAIKPAMLVLLGAVAVVLVLASANIATLLLARSMQRTREMTVRLTLGAGRWRLVRQMATESLILATVGGAAGVALSSAILPVLVRLIPREYLTTFPELVRVDRTAAAVAAALTVAVGLVFGLVPALVAARLDGVNQRTATLSRDGRRTARMLMAGEVALALVVAIGAALMIRSYRHVEHIALGFNPDGLLGATVFLPPAKYSTPKRIEAFYRDTLDRIRALPNVTGAAAVSDLPLAYRIVDVTSFDFTIDGQPAENGRAPYNANCRIVTDDYFRVAETPLVSGRVFGADDDGSRPRGAVINETMARAFWGDRDPVGQRLQLGTRYGTRDALADAGGAVVIIGVVKDVKQTRAIDAPVRQEMFLSGWQFPGEMRHVGLVVRSRTDPRTLATSIRQAVRAVDPEQPVFDVDTLSNIVADSFGPKRLTLFLLMFFAAVALSLAAIGLYAIVNCAVVQRKREIGIRMAVGARPGKILVLIVSDGARMAGAGVIAGMALAAAITRLMQSQLYGVSATDPVVFAGAAALLVSIAVAASAVPAFRATKVDPLIVLKAD